MFWQQQGVTVVESDLVDFLDRLERRCEQGVRKGRGDRWRLIHWLPDPVFRALRRRGVVPSETQVIDALIKYVEREARRSDLADLAVTVREATDTVMGSRPSFRALRRVGAKVAEMVEDAQDGLSLEGELEPLTQEREGLGKTLARQASRYIAKDDAIFVYSQSTRVVATLEAVPRAWQESCRVFIGECRPRSPASFQDAYSVYDQLKDTRYRITLVPDVAFANLARRGIITKVIMGAHELCEVDGYLGAQFKWESGRAFCERLPVLVCRVFSSVRARAVMPLAACADRPCAFPCGCGEPPD